MSRVKIIANPISGRGKSRNLVDELSEALKTHGFEVETVLTSAKGDAISAASCADESYEAVCSVGGDGTMNEVLNGIAGKDISLALLPAGLSNVLAVELGITADPAAVANAIKNRTTVEVDLCTGGGRYFVAMAGAGWDAHIVHSIASGRRSPLGFGGYVLPIARSLITYDFPHIKVMLDGSAAAEKAGLVVVGNVKQYGGPFQVTKHANFTDGLLDVYVVERASPVEMLKIFAAVLWGDHTRHGNTKYLRGKQVELTSKGSVPVQIDGEAAGKLPMIFEITGHKQHIVVPA